LKGIEGLSMLPESSDTGCSEPWGKKKLAMALTEPKVEEAIKNPQIEFTKEYGRY